MYKRIRRKARELTSDQMAVISQISAASRKLGPPQARNKVILVGRKVTSRAAALAAAQGQYPVYFQRIGAAQIDDPVRCDNAVELQDRLDRMAWGPGYGIVRKAHDGTRPKDDRPAPVPYTPRFGRDPLVGRIGIW